MSNPYKPKKISGWFDLLLVCILAWVLVIVSIVLLPEIVIRLVR
ncbi:hypothetical protein BECAL_02959 [Bellilinea caldifistulae]|nr:hypothetical protein [Bellilinea caldifistulae]GAP11766.1 hypothetical protein BECAL_02959 [Bellilinea caldifistulae]